MSATSMIPARNLLRAAPAAEPPTQPLQLHAEAAKFLNHAVETHAANQDLIKRLDALTVENATLVYKLNFTQHEYDKVVIQRDELRAAVDEMNVQLGVVTAQNIAMAEATRAQAQRAVEIGVKAMEAATRRMLRVGIDPNPPEEKSDGDAGTKAMGEKYGAGFDSKAA